MFINVMKFFLQLFVLVYKIRFRMNDVKNVSIFVCRFLDTIIYLALETLGIIIVCDTIICLTLKSPEIIISCNVVKMSICKFTKINSQGFVLFIQIYIKIQHVFWWCLFSILGNRIGDVMVSMLASTAVGRVFEPQSCQTKDYKVDMCCFFAKHAALRRKSNDWLARNQDNMSEWGDMFVVSVS